MRAGKGWDLKRGREAGGSNEEYKQTFSRSLYCFTFFFKHLRYLISQKPIKTLYKIRLILYLLFITNSPRTYLFTS